MSTHALRIQRTMPASIDRVFEAWTDAEQLARWFVVDAGWTAKATSELRVGGKYRVEMFRSDGTVFVCWGEYLEVARPRRLVFTWSSAIPAVQNSRVTIELAPIDAKRCALTLLHELLPDTDEGRAHTIGWEGSLDNLARHLGIEGGAP